LSFKDTVLESAFLQDHAVHSLNIVRISLLFAALIYLLYAQLDFQLIPEKAQMLLTIRGAGALFLIGAAAFSYVKAAPKYFQFTMTAVVIVAGIGVVSMVLIAEQSGWYGYYGGVILALIYSHALLRLRFIFASLAGWFIVGLYCILSLQLTPAPSDVTLNNTVYLLTGGVLGMFASYGIEFHTRTVFWKSRMLDESQQQLAIEYQRTADELAAARALQLAMLPEILPNHPDIDLDVWMSTATEVGGDYYDFVIREDGMLVFAIGDATGHGSRAGALVTATKLLFSAYAPHDEPAQFLRRATRSLRSMRIPGLYMAFALGCICRRTLSLAGAGLPPAILYRALDRSLEQISLKGMPLGSPFDVDYEAKTFTLFRGDVVVLMSDGFTELADEQGRMFEVDRIGREIEKVADGEARQIITHLAGRAAAWRGNAPLRDDITVVVLKVK
jgi:hypothetical protein